MVQGAGVILYTLIAVALIRRVRPSHGGQDNRDTWTVEGWPVYRNSWAVQVRGGPRIAEEVAFRHGLVNKGKIGNTENYYHFALEEGQADAFNKTSDLEAELHVGYVERQAVKRHSKRDYIVPVDPEWSQQWSLKNTGDVTNGLSSTDLRVEAAWLQNINGRGVVTTIIDDGVERSHPDLKDNYNQYASWDFMDEDGDPSPSSAPSDSHGTHCAGEVGMVKNSNCGIGVAHGGTIGGIRLDLAHTSDIIEATAFSYKYNYTSVYSNSWGPLDYGFVVDGPGLLSQLALQEAANQGRDGKGCVYIWAAGNGGKYYDSCAADGYASSIYTIAVGSADQRGAQAYYDEPCTAKMAVTYSYNSVSGKGKQITTTTLNGKCTHDFTGTSASAPLLAGTVALTLQANPNLSWRDVQYLIAYTSDTSLLVKGDWVTNGGGMRVSQLFGFGAVDVEAMVTRAKRWTPVPPQRTVSVVPSQLTLQEASAGSPSVFSFTVGDAVKFVEHVVLRLTIKVQGYETPYSVSTLCKYLSSLESSPSSSCDYIDSIFSSDGVANQQLDSWLSSPHPRRGDIQVELTSPQGTTSVVLPYRKYDFVNVDGYTRWPFMSVHHWGEYPAGRWDVAVYFRSSQGNVSISDAKLTVYGTADVPLAVRTIPKTCDKSCARACASPGPDGCDACAKGYFRDASTLKCVSECPQNTTTYSGYCVAGYVIFPDAGVATSIVISVTITVVVLSALLVLVALTFGACVCFRLRLKRRTPPIYSALYDFDAEEWPSDQVPVQ